jgi:hypothetical protein
MILRVIGSFSMIAHLVAGAAGRVLVLENPPKHDILKIVHQRSSSPLSLLALHLLQDNHQALAAAAAMWYTGIHARQASLAASVRPHLQNELTNAAAQRYVGIGRISMCCTGRTGPFQQHEQLRYAFRRFRGQSSKAFGTSHSKQPRITQVADTTEAYKFSGTTGDSLRCRCHLWDCLSVSLQGQAETYLLPAQTYDVPGCTG